MREVTARLRRAGGGVPLRDVPEDFSAFVTRYGPRLSAACRDASGNDRVADAMRVDLLAAVALGWRLRPARWRLRRALTRLDRLLRREVRGYRLLPVAERQTQIKGPTEELIDRPIGDSTKDIATTKDMAALASAAWRRAAVLRRRGWLSLAAAALVLLGFVVVGPRAAPLPQPSPEPTATPDDVIVLPPFRELAGIVQTGRTPLPTDLDVNPDALLPLATAPLQTAIAVVEPNQGRLIVIGAEGVRQIDDRSLVGARLVTTSLSPAGHLIALPSAGGLLVIELWTGAIRSVPVLAAQNAVTGLVWRTGDRVLVPGPNGAVEVDLLTGETAVVEGINGADVVMVQGDAEAPLVEMVSSASIGNQRSRIRFWRNPPPSVPVLATTPSTTPPPATPSITTSPSATPSTTTSPTAPPPTATPTVPAFVGNFDERPVSGPAWISDWRGPAWASALLYARACSPESVRLPADVGIASSVVGALQPNGRHAGTLVTVDKSELEVLGFLRAQELLVLATKGGDAALIGWTPVEGDFVVVASYFDVVRVSVTDLLLPS
jgi:hypothetical protein